MRQGAGERFVSDIFNEVDEEVRREQLKKLWERYGILIIASGRSVRRRGRRLARLSMVGGQEGRRSGRRVRGRSGPRRAGQAQGGRGGLRQDRGRWHGELPHARQLREAAVLAQQRSQGGGCDLRCSSPPIAASTRCSAISPRCARRSSWSTPHPMTNSRARLEPLTAADRPFRHSARSCSRSRHGAPTMPPKCAAGPT